MTTTTAPKRGRGRPKGSTKKRKILQRSQQVEFPMGGATPETYGPVPVSTAEAIPSRKTRWENLQTLIVGLVTDLKSGGFHMDYFPFVQPISREIPDPKTGGIVAHVEEPLSAYLQRVSVKDNFSQRQAFDHISDHIYRRLIRDFIEGAVMPEAKVAALSRSGDHNRAESLKDPEIYYSVIDGLQRLYCYCIAVLLVWKREELLKADAITGDAWEYFKDAVMKEPDAPTATRNLLDRLTRYEIFYRIDLAGLLHYMVTFNTGQRRMSLQNQLEIMQRPMLKQLEESAGVSIFHSLSATPGDVKKKEQFAAADLILATQAFLSANAQVNPGKEAEKFLETEQFLQEPQDIDALMTAMVGIVGKVHPALVDKYEETNKKFVLSAGGTMLIGLAASLGFVYSRKGPATAEASLNKLVTIIGGKGKDPLKLEEYNAAVSLITSARGKNIRRLVYDTFLRFFSGVSPTLEWLDTVQQITG